MDIPPLSSDEKFMVEALKEAAKAMENDEVPIGAVIVSQNQVIGKGHNQTELLNDVTAHAEILAITAASQYLGSKYLKNCTMYVTLEPCSMCAGALLWSQIEKLIYGASDEKRGFMRFGQKLLHPKTKVRSDVLGEQAAEMLQEFFKDKRDH